MATNLNRGIRIRWASSHYVSGAHDGVRVRIDAVGSCEMPVKIFAYRLMLTNPRTATREGFFSHICSPPDLTDYPEDGPTPPRRPEWFRLAYVDVLVRSVQEAEDLVQAVRSDVRRLKATLDTMDTLVPGGSEDIGALDCIESSDSSLSSQGSEGGTPEPAYGAPTSVSCDATFAQALGEGVAWDAPGVDLTLQTASVDLVARSVSQWLLVQGFPGLDDVPDGAVVLGAEVTLQTDYDTLCPDLPGPCPQDDPTPQSSCAQAPAPTLRALFLYHPLYGFSPASRANNEEFGTAHGFGDGTDMWDWPVVAMDARRQEFGIALAITSVAGGVRASVTGVTLTLHYRPRL